MSHKKWQKNQRQQQKLLKLRSKYGGRQKLPPLQRLYDEENSDSQSDNDIENNKEPQGNKENE